MHDSTVFASNRFGIRPFPRVATYPTSWKGKMTFEQISEDIRPHNDTAALGSRLGARPRRFPAKRADGCLGAACC